MRSVEVCIEIKKGKHYPGGAVFHISTPAGAWACTADIDWVHLRVFRLAFSLCKRLLSRVNSSSLVACDSVRALRCAICWSTCRVYGIRHFRFVDAIDIGSFQSMDFTAGAEVLATESRTTYLGMANFCPSSESSLSETILHLSLFASFQFSVRSHFLPCAMSDGCVPNTLSLRRTDVSSVRDELVLGLVMIMRLIVLIKFVQIGTPIRIIGC